MAQFGFGRRYIRFSPIHLYRLSCFRICPGRHLAKDSLWIAIASILALFRISKIKGDDGEEITPPVKFDTGLIRYKRVQCSGVVSAYAHPTAIQSRSSVISSLAMRQLDSFCHGWTPHWSRPSMVYWKETLYLFGRRLVYNVIEFFLRSCLELHAASGFCGCHHVETVENDIQLFS
jgi:hypothetical protein